MQTDDSEVIFPDCKDQTIELFADQSVGGKSPLSVFFSNVCVDRCGTPLKVMDDSKLTAAETAVIPTKSGVYDLELYSGSGPAEIVDKFLYGKFTFDGEVTVG